MSDVPPIDPTALPKHFDSSAGEARWLCERERLNVHAADGTFHVAAVDFAEPVEA